MTAAAFDVSKSEVKLFDNLEFKFSDFTVTTGGDCVG